MFKKFKTTLLTSLLFAAVAFTIYSPSLHGDFVFDDDIIQNNPLIHITQVSQLKELLFSKQIDRRIGLLSFALNYYFGGLHPFGYHLVNVILHILNGLILFLLSYQILILTLDKRKGVTDALKISFLGSLIWLTHPLQTQAVSYVVQRLTSLSSLFFLLSLLCYIRGRVDHTHKRLVLFMLSTLFGLLALGTKQNAATLPLFIILSEFFFLQHKPFKLDRKKLGLIICSSGLFILISGIYLGTDFISRISTEYQHKSFTLFERVLTQLRVVIFYISLLIYPHPSRLNLDHDFALSSSLFSPLTTFLSLLFIINSLALAIFMIKRYPLVSYAIVWFFGNLLIESSIIPLELVFEHRVYLPSMGLIILAIGLGVSLFKKEWRKWITYLSILLILIFSYWTYERSFVWRGPFSLWMDAVKKSPHKARPYNNLGIAYGIKGKWDEAIEKYKQALNISPYFAEAHSNLGNAYNKKGMFDQAISECTRAIAIKPNFAEPHTVLGIVYQKRGELDKAISQYKKAIIIKPNFAMAHANLGAVYGRKGMLDEAISECKKALAINPHHIEARNNLGNAYAKKGMLDEALSEHKKALTINPNFAEAQYNLCVSYYKKGNYALARLHCDKAVELGYIVNPKFLELLKPYR